MIELDNQQKIKILNLFNNKRFSELEIEIESISKTGERSPFLSNLLGVAKIEKKNSIPIRLRERNETVQGGDNWRFTL
mgnify:CR=1 FL=1